MIKQPLAWAGCLLLCAAFGYSQSGPDKVCEVNVTSPKAGDIKSLEDARKKHNEFHKAEKDKTSIMVWNIVTGPYTGDLLQVSCGLTWKGMDGHEDFDKRDADDIAKNMPTSLGTNRQSYYVFRGDLSRDTEKADGEPAKRMTIVHYFVKPGGTTQFTEGIKRVNAAIEKTKYASKPGRWYQLANGGEGPHFVLVVDRNSWADMQGPEQSMDSMLKQAYGDDDKTSQTLRDAIDHTVSEMAEFRRDLSYMAGK